MTRRELMRIMCRNDPALSVALVIRGVGAGAGQVPTIPQGPSNGVKEPANRGVAIILQ